VGFQRNADTGVGRVLADRRDLHTRWQELEPIRFHDQAADVGKIGFYLVFVGWAKTE
jgi:hypothetical protein